MELLGLDLGNYQVKTSKGVRFLSKYKAALGINYKSADDVLEYQGKQYVIGKGAFDTTLSKAEKDSLILFLYGIAKSTPKDVVKVVLGLPAVQFKEQAVTMANKFKGTYNIKLTAEGTTVTRNIHIADVKVYPEGAGVFYSEVYPEHLMDQDVLIVDIGGLTANIVLFKDCDVESFGGYRKGCLNIFQSILEEVDQTQVLGITIEAVDDAIHRNKPLVVNGDSINLIPYLQKHIYLYVTELIKEINKYQAMTHPILLCGGGAELIRDELMKTFKNVHFIKDKNAMFANAQGFEAMAESIWG